jgi:NADPH:quinone reductase-like Zn-dependent oxidoreductase
MANQAIMRLVRLKAPASPENLKLVEEDRSEPGPGEVLVRIRACSLNFHDAMVIRGAFPSADGRIPLNDGAGEVIAIGEDVDALKVGDAVVSTFFPNWFGGEPTPAVKQDIPIAVFPWRTSAAPSRTTNPGSTSAKSALRFD